MFVTVGDANVRITLGELKPVASNEGTDLDYNIDIQFINNDGSSDAANSFVWTGSRWEFLSGGDASSVYLPAGKGLWVGNGVDPEESAVSLRSAGEINQNDIKFELDNDYGYVYVGNGYPVATTLGSICLEIAEHGDYESELAYNIDVQFINSDGSSDENNSFVWNGSTWEYLSGGNANAVNIPEGKALWVGNGVDYSDYGPVYMRIPAPEL